MTNAVKYGALSNEVGHIDIEWSVVPQGGENRLQFSWIEVDGPIVAVPEHKGFGSKLIKSSLGSMGSVDVAYNPTGLVLKMDASMAQIGAVLTV